MNRAIPLPLLVTATLAAALASPGCGRTELDTTFGTTPISVGGANGSPTGGTGGRGGGGGTTSGSGGRPATTGAAGNGGTARPTTPIPCGAASCASATEICCVQRRMNGRGGPACIPAQTMCPSGVSLACVDSSACAAGQVCCEPIIGATGTACADPETCLRTPGVILCSSSADCPSVAPHCCATEDGGLCAAQACPAGGGGPAGGG
jgi:hypothetical protein